MTKIPVFRTIGGAYSFTFGNLATIFGLIWLPMAGLLALQYYVAARYLDSYLSAFVQGNLYELNSATGLRYLSIIVALLLQAILVTPVMRQALGLRNGGAVVSFAIGPTALRVFAATIALTVIVIAFEYVFLIALLIAGAVAAVVVNSIESLRALSSPLALALGVVGLIVVFLGAMLFVWLRLSFFVVAVAVAERKIDLIRAWRLTGWSFWRLFAVTLATVLPLTIVYLVLMWAALGFPLLQLPAVAVTAEWKGAPSKMLEWIVHFAEGRLPYLFSVIFILAPFSVGLSTGAAAAAYRAVVPSPEKNGPAVTVVPETSAA